jgi:hypothetical protein
LQLVKVFSVALANSVNDGGLRWGAYKFTSRPDNIGIMCQEISEKKRWSLVLSQRHLLLEHLTFYLVGMTQLNSWEATTNVSSGCFIIAVPPAVAPGPQGQTTNTQHQALGSSASSADTPGNAAAARAPGVPWVAAGGAGASEAICPVTVTPLDRYLREKYSYPSEHRVIFSPSIPTKKTRGGRVEDPITVLDANDSSFADRPILFTVDKAVYASAQKLREYVVKHGVEGVCVESNLYEAAASIVPDNVEIVGEPGAEVSAASLHGIDVRKWAWTTVLKLPHDATPELNVRSKSTPSVPSISWNGELKSCATLTTIAQGLTYTIMDMNRGFFMDNTNLFHSYPPTGFAVIGYPHVGYILSVEWIGHFHVALASLSFIIGSDLHISEVKKISDRAKGLYKANRQKTLPADLIWTKIPNTVAEGKYYDKVMWCKHKGRFLKRIRSQMYEASVFQNMARVYTKLESLWWQKQEWQEEQSSSASSSSSISASGVTSPPSGLVLDSKLWYGSHEVLVDMAHIDECSELSADVAYDMLIRTSNDHSAAGETRTELWAVAKAVADTVAWLAGNNIVYTDIRGSNIPVKEKMNEKERETKDKDKEVDIAPEKQYYLIDYDDCGYSDEPITSLKGYITFLQSAKKNDSPHWLASNIILAAYETTGSVFQTALEDAFEKRYGVSGHKRLREGGTTD